MDAFLCYFRYAAFDTVGDGRLQSFAVQLGRDGEKKLFLRGASAKQRSTNCMLA